MKEILLNKWIHRLVYLAIVVGLSVSYYTERELRIGERAVHKQVEDVYESDLNETFRLVNDLTARQIYLGILLDQYNVQNFQMRLRIYKMYEELRKHDKTLPPWGEEKPIDPEEDKWTTDEVPRILHN